ncbi:MAG: hypothetical protein AAB383_03160 [Patescibacteria group bacterium]
MTKLLDKQTGAEKEQTKNLGVLAKTAELKIFTFSNQKAKKTYLGKGKNLFGDGVKYQKEIRKEWL